MPPKGWSPPFALEKGTNGQSAESFRFLIRKQLTSHLCMRRGNSDHARKAASRCVPARPCVACRDLLRGSVLVWRLRPGGDVVAAWMS